MMKIYMFGLCIELTIVLNLHPPKQKAPEPKLPKPEYLLKG